MVDWSCSDRKRSMIKINVFSVNLRPTRAAQRERGDRLRLTSFRSIYGRLKLLGKKVVTD